jgi:hypothetical protein
MTVGEGVASQGFDLVDDGLRVSDGAAGAVDSATVVVYDDTGAEGC